MINVNEIFATVQGEGRFTGTPSTFVRLQYCPVGCPWCDTMNTWTLSERKRVTAAQVLAKADSNSPQWAPMTELEIVDAVKALAPRHFVITGGEPCAQDILALTVKLALLGRVQLETSGTHPINVSHRTFVTVSPKLDMPGGFALLPQAIQRADEIKMPVAGQADIDRLKALLGPQRVDCVVALQPVSIEPGATALCVETCVTMGWQLSLQTHKLAAVR